MKKREGSILVSIKDGWEIVSDDEINDEDLVIYK